MSRTRGCRGLGRSGGRWAGGGQVAEPAAQAAPGRWRSEEVRAPRAWPRSSWEGQRRSGSLRVKPQVRAGAGRAGQGRAVPHSGVTAGFLGQWGLRGSSRFSALSPGAGIPSERARLSGPSPAPGSRVREGLSPRLGAGCAGLRASSPHGEGRGCACRETAWEGAGARCTVCAAAALSTVCAAAARPGSLCWGRVGAAGQAGAPWRLWLGCSSLPRRAFLRRRVGRG